MPGPIAAQFAQPMKPSFTDLFVRRPVLAIVINLVIVIAGVQAWRSLNVRQYPRSENASVSIIEAASE